MHCPLVKIISVEGIQNYLRHLCLMIPSASAKALAFTFRIKLEFDDSEIGCQSMV